MRKSFILSGILGAGIVIASGFGVASSNGYPYATGSPSDGSTCSGCHSGGSATTTATISASPAWGGSGNNLTYTPGTTYTITIQEAGYTKYGFDIEIMNSNSASATTDAGTMSVLNSTYSKLNGTGPTNITHKTPIPSTTNVTLKWVAPASGTAYLYAAVLGVNGNGSTSGDKVTNKAFVLTPAATPVASFNASSSSVCVGQTVTLTNTSTGSPTSYAWTMTGGTPASSTAQNPTVSYASAGTYTVSLVATNGGGSSAPVSHVITVNANPSVAATSTTICSGHSSTISASGATTYLWNTGATTAAITVSPSTTTTYSVTGTTSGCSSTATGVVTVNANPSVAATSTTICSGHSSTISASGATTYLWNTGATTAAITVSPTTTTTYTVTGTTGGCSSTATGVVTVTNCTGINNYSIANQVNIFPNPASDYLNVNLGLLSGTKTAELYDVSGRLVLQRSTEGDALQLSLADISKGTYFVKIMNDKNVVAVKMVMISK